MVAQVASRSASRTPKTEPGGSGLCVQNQKPPWNANAPASVAEGNISRPEHGEPERDVERNRRRPELRQHQAEAGAQPEHRRLRPRLRSRRPGRLPARAAEREDEPGSPGPRVQQPERSQREHASLDGRGRLRRPEHGFADGDLGRNHRRLQPREDRPEPVAQAEHRIAGGVADRTTCGKGRAWPGPSASSAGRRQCEEPEADDDRRRVVLSCALGLAPPALASVRESSFVERAAAPYRATVSCDDRPDWSAPSTPAIPTEGPRGGGLTASGATRSGRSRFLFAAAACSRGGGRPRLRSPQHLGLALGHELTHAQQSDFYNAPAEPALRRGRGRLRRLREVRADQAGPRDQAPPEATAEGFRPLPGKAR